MGEAVAFAIPFALGVALNPIPVLAIVLILAAPRGLLRGTALLLGALSSLAIIVVVLFGLESGADPIEDGETATWVSVVQLVLGLALLALAARKWRSRPRPGGDDPEMPGWMSAIETLTPARAVAAGAALMGLNPKNIMITAGAVTSIAGTGAATSSQVVALAVYVLIATASVALPVLVTALFGARAAHGLGVIRDWMLRHHKVILAAILVVLGTVLLVDAISSLSGR
jgi:threonine/homoserine/homoserine lactone efflux protein